MGDTGGLHWRVGEDEARFSRAAKRATGWPDEQYGAQRCEMELIMRTLVDPATYRRLVYLVSAIALGPALSWPW
jgi:hypothetical protein